MTLAENIAMQATVPAAHQVAADLGLRDQLLLNPHVDIDTWRALYRTTGSRKVSAKAAKEAVRAGLTPDRVAHVAAVEARPAVLGALFKTVCPTTDLMADPNIRAAVGSEKLADDIQRRYGALLDWDALAILDADELAPPLRVWRLLSEQVSDDEVLAALLTFDTWATNYLQRPLGWVVHQRPQLLPHLIGKAGDAVLTQVAGSVRIGTLTADEQRTLLRVDGDPAQVTAADANARAFMWMAAASNPTVHLEVLDALEDHLDKCTEIADPSRSVRNRRRYRNWHVTSLAEVSDPDKLGPIIGWAVPTDGKARGGAVDQLLDNPALTCDEASLLARRLAEFFTDGVLHATVLVGRPGTELIEKFAGLFPEEVADHQLAKLLRKSQVSVLGVAEATRRGLLDPDTDADTDGDTDAANADRRLGFHLGPGEVRWLSERVADNQAAWRSVYTLADTLSDQTLAGFADTCVAISL